MICRLESLHCKRLDRLHNSHYARRIRANFDAYNAEYDFCTFYEITGSGASGIVNVFNAAMTLELDADANPPDASFLAELAQFAVFHQPQTLELPMALAKPLVRLLGGVYAPQERTEFAYGSGKGITAWYDEHLAVNEFPRLDEVFGILKTGFPVIAENRGLWQTDASHRIRRGLAQAFVFDGCTTATIQYIENGTVLIGHVCTLPEQRGTLHARRLLYWLGETLSAKGLAVRLFARSNRVSYYEEIGFQAVASDQVLEPISAKQEDVDDKSF